MRCMRCGNDNPGDNRFCGMCGGALLSPPVSPATAVPDTQTKRAASGAVSIPSPPVVTAPPPRPPEPVRVAAPASHEQPSISGPSFLGLNDPAPRKRASLSIDPHHGGGSGDVDYLLDDDDQHKGGAGKGIFILVLLAIVVGFGYLRWRNNGFSWLTATPNKPAATDQTPTDPGTTPPSSTQPSVAPETAQPAPSQPAGTTPSGTAPQTTPTPAAGTGTAANPPAATNPPTTSAKNDQDASPAQVDKPADKTDKTDQDDDASAKDEEAAAPPVKHAAPVPAPKPTRTVPVKPSAAAATPVRTGDAVAEAQRYLYGKGAPQDCDRGLRLLKPAANQANTKAMIEMGALYSAGLCTPRDLPTAYRWFAQALRKDPENQAVQTDLQKLWGEMTQPERQLAIKLSQ